MNFVQDCEYILKANTHSRVALAFRHGIVTPDERVVGYFSRLSKTPANNVNRTRCHFIIDGVKVEVIVQELELVTVLPDRIMSDREAEKMFCMFDAYLSIPVNPPYFSYQEVADWRMAFIEGAGRIKKDDLRRAAKRKGLPPSILDPYEQLGIKSDFFDEVRSLREIVRTLLDEKQAKELDFGNRINVEERLDEGARIFSLALTDQTRTWDEIPENIEQLNKEYLEEKEQWDQDLHLSNIEAAREALYAEEGDPSLKKLQGCFPERSNPQKFVNELIYFAKYGLPESIPMNQVGITNTHNPIFHLRDCTILRIIRNMENDGWSKLFYEYKGQGYLLATKFLKIVSTYEVGDRGVWWVEVNKNLVCLHESQN